VQCNGVALPTVSLTGKQLDGQDNAEPVSMLNACFTALDRALKAAAPAAGSPEEEAAAEAAAGGAGADDARAAALPPGGAHSMEPYHFSLREIRVPSKDPRVVALEAPSKPVCFTPARSFLQAGATTRVALRFFPVESKERCVCSRLSFSRPPLTPPSRAHALAARARPSGRLAARAALAAARGNSLSALISFSLYVFRPFTLTLPRPLPRAPPSLASAGPCSSRWASRRVYPA
jgi:hypothetical protein